MEKVKAFVIKHQLWFKLAAIALLVCTVFTPLVYYGYSGKNEFYPTIWEHILLGQSIANQYYFISVFAYFYLSITILIIVLLIFSFFNKKVLKITLYFYYIDTAFLLGISIFYFTQPNACPHIAFFLSLLLLIADIITLWQLHKAKQTAERTVE